MLRHGRIMSRCRPLVHAWCAHPAESSAPMRDPTGKSRHNDRASQARDGGETIEAPPWPPTAPRPGHPRGRPQRRHRGDDAGRQFQGCIVGRACACRARHGGDGVRAGGRDDNRGRAIPHHRRRPTGIARIRSLTSRRKSPKNFASPWIGLAQNRPGKLSLITMCRQEWFESRREFNSVA